MAIRQVGEYLQMDGLVQHCGEAAPRLVTPQSMLRILDSAVSQGADPTVTAACADVWGQNSTEILLLAGLVALLSHGSANVLEDELFARAADWLRANRFIDTAEAQPEDPSEETRRRAVVDQVLSCIRFGLLRPATLMEAVELASPRASLVSAAMVAALRQHLTREKPSSPKPSSPKPSSPTPSIAVSFQVRTGAPRAFNSANHRDVIEALSSLDDDKDLSPHAMRAAMEMMLAWIPPPDSTERRRERIVLAMWDHAPIGSLDLNADQACDFVMLPFQYCGDWRLFFVDRRDQGPKFIYLMPVPGDAVDCRRSYECAAAFRRALERAVATGEVFHSASLGERTSTTIGSRSFPYPPAAYTDAPMYNWKHPNTATAVLQVIARMRECAVPSRKDVRDRIRGVASPPEPTPPRGVPGWGAPQVAPPAPDMTLVLHRAIESALTLKAQEKCADQRVTTTNALAASSNLGLAAVTTEIASMVRVGTLRPAGQSRYSL
jgi:hypothetical protein